MSLISRMLADFFRGRGPAPDGEELAQALCAEGARQMEAGRRPEAMRLFRKALSHDPQCRSAHMGMGLLHEREGKLEQALEHLRQAMGGSVAERGISILAAKLMQRSGRLAEAESLLRRLISEYPDQSGLTTSLSEVLRAQQRFDDAVTFLEGRLVSRPEDVEACEQLARLYRDSGFVDKALSCFGRVAELRPDDAMAVTAVLFQRQFVPHDRARQLEQHAEWGRRFAGDDPGRTGVDMERAGMDSDRRLRIGYVSADLNLSSAMNFIEPLLANRQSAQFEVICYHSSKREDRATTRLRGLADGWCNVAGLDDDALCRRIRTDRIDILVDLNGHTRGNRLTAFARRPAPVQVSYLGYGATTGVPAMDWRLTDAHVDPPGNDAFYVERLYRLPNCMWCFVPPTAAPEVSALPASASEGVTFASFNQIPKLSDRILAAWARILALVPGSRLMIVGVRPGAGRRRIVEALAAGGVEERRVTLIDRVSFPRYLALHAETDIALDSFPYGGGATTCNALWMGVPVLTLTGDETMARSGASLLGAVGMPDWVASSDEEYVEKAHEFAGRRDALASIRRGLRERVRESVLCDAPGFMKDVEAGYRAMWHDWCVRNESKAEATR